jgi:hypothetical protein
MWRHSGHGMGGARYFGFDGPPMIRCRLCPRSLLILSDNRFRDDGALDFPESGSLQARIDAENGREGDVVFVNDRVLPALEIRPGEVQRWRVINASAARVYRLALQGHTFLHVGSDGGLFERPVEVDEVRDRQRRARRAAGARCGSARQPERAPIAAVRPVRAADTARRLGPAPRPADGALQPRTVAGRNRAAGDAAPDPRPRHPRRDGDTADRDDAVLHHCATSLTSTVPCADDRFVRTGGAASVSTGTEQSSQASDVTVETAAHIS